MISNDEELQVMLSRVQHFQNQVANIRRSEKDTENYKLSVSGFMAELDRMNLEIREYLWSHPGERLQNVA